MYTLLFLNPGHFHAALTLRENNPLVNGDVYVYAEEGPDLDSFLALVGSFNDRAERATKWNLIVYTGHDFLEKLISEKKGEVAVVAGKNDSKIESIARLHEAGIHVLADKPWLVNVGGLGALERATSKGALVMDIMTGRFETTHVIPTRLTGVPEVFGEFQSGPDGEPTVSMTSVHHLYKTVNGVPLVRPDWYFDVGVQGDGIVDIPSHLVDKVLWMMGTRNWDFEKDVALESARLWDTEISGEAFTRITNVPAFPEFLAGDVSHGKLHYRCNGEFTFRLGAARVHLKGEWHQEAPPGGGDTYVFLFQGTRAQVAVEMGPHTEFQSRVFVRPAAGEAGVARALEQTLDSWQVEFPGVAAAQGANGYEVTIPNSLRTTHEEHFAMVLNEFLGYLNAGTWPEQLASTLRTKYTITARASELAGGAQRQTP